MFVLKHCCHNEWYFPLSFVKDYAMYPIRGTSCEHLEIECTQACCQLIREPVACVYLDMLSAN